MIKPLHAAAIAATLTLTACTPHDEPTEIATPPAAAPPAAPAATAPSTQPTRTAIQYATALKAEMPRAQRAYEMTKRTDSNRMLGTPNGYTSAAVLADKASAACTSALGGIDCGVVVEVWTSPQAAAERVSYIQGILKHAPMLGAERDIQAGAALLRVNEDVVGKSVASAYEGAWRRVVS